MAGPHIASQSPESCEVPVSPSVGLSNLAKKVIETCRHHTAGLLATLAMATVGTAPALAQQGAVAGPTTSASATVVKEVSVGDIPRKIDGTIDFDVWFAGKTADEIRRMSKRLSDSDYDNYNDWKTEKNAGSIPKNEEKVAKLIKKNQEWVSIIESIIAINGGKLDKSNIKRIQEALDDPAFSPDLKERLSIVLKNALRNA